MRGSFDDQWRAEQEFWGIGGGSEVIENVHSHQPNNMPRGPWHVQGPFVGASMGQLHYEVCNEDVQIARCDLAEDARRIADALNKVEGHE
jgi:hypothetical protein